MITELTPEQLDALPAHRDKWLAIGLSTEPANRKLAEEGAVMAYEAAGLTPPTTFIWADSPLAGAEKVNELCGGGDVGSRVSEAIYGQHDAGWLSFYAFFRDHCNLEVTHKLDGLIQVAENAGWWWALEGTAVLTERPDSLKRDGQSRLHCEDGPALHYRDGYSIYAWHGTRVPEGLIKDEWSVEDIFKEGNAEVRRCAIEKIGWDKFVETSGLVPVASADDPGNEPYTLDLYDLPSELRNMYEDQARILLCTNGSVERDGTRRRFGLPVPAHHTDPVAAAAELYGVSKDQYMALEVRK